MNPMAGPNPFEMLLMMLLGGSFGMPSGVPPTEEDPLAAKIAPAECLFYASWAGTGSPDSSSTNHTEQMLAEPEVQEFLTRGRTKFLDMMGQASSDPNEQQIVADIGKILELVQGKPGAIFVSEVIFNGNAPPIIKGGGLLRVGDDATEIQTVLNRIQARAPPGKASSVQVGGRTFSRVELDDEAPPITWGVAGTYLFVGLGDGSLEALMQRAGGQPPGWLADVRTKLAVPRVSSTMYVDVKRIVQIAVEQSGEPEANRILSVLGLDKVQSYAMVSGMNDTGCLSRALLEVEGAGSGLLSWIDAKPLTAGDLSVIGRDAPAAVAFRLDPSKLLDLWLDLAEQIEPRAAEDTREGLAEFERELGIRLRDDVLNSLGDTWRVFAQPGSGGLVGGWTVAISVRDRGPLERLQKTMVAMLSAQLQQAPQGAPSLQSQTINGRTVYTLAFPPPVPVSPSWCLADDELFITVSPQTMEPLLSGVDGPSLAQRSELQSLFGANGTTLAVVYIDTRAVAETFLPMLPDMLRGLPPGMPPLESADLPSSESIVPHLQPTFAAVRRTADGVELVSQQTLPGSNIGASAPVAVAVALPAVQAAREAARRTQSMNNLKQIGIALHNYHDTYKAFPAGYNADADGKPLLSWRVHILPFVEERHLYEQFHLNEPWDSPHNKQFVEQMPEVYRSPNSTGQPGMSNYLGVGGADGVFVRPQPSDKLGTKFANIRDGTSNTIMTVEVPDESAVIWTKPGDFAPNKQAPTKGLTGMRPGGFLAGLADGSVRFIAEAVDTGVLNALFTKSGGEAVPVP